MRDVFHIRELLGHSRIEKTLKYVHVANAVSLDQTRYSCKVAKTVQEASLSIEEGFEFVCEMDGHILFRKPK